MSSDFISLFTGMSERDIGYILKSIVQRSINTELTNSELSNVDNKTPVLLTNSKDVELMNDIGIQSLINIEAPTQYIMPEEPDGKDLKIWLKFQNAGELRDWSYQKNKAYAVGANTMPGLFYRSENRNMIKTELYSYFNGASHYGYVVDAPTVQILPNITANKVSNFFIRLKPISLAKLLYAENNSLFTKVDDDQLRYGYSCTIDTVGNIHFYVKNNYRQYHLFVKDAYASLLTNPILAESPIPFRLDNFNTTNFSTNYETLCSLVDEEPPFDDWFFKYDPTDHSMSATLTIENNPSEVYSDSDIVTEKPYLSCPIQEGKWTHSGTVQTTIYDNSGNNNNGTLTGITGTPGGQWNDDNTLTSLGSNTAGDGGGLAIDFGAITALNTLTEFTITFWYNPLTEVINNKSYNTRLVTKGYAAADTIYIERRTGQNDIKFSFRLADNVERTITFSNPFPTENQWYLVTCRWKTGEGLKVGVNGVESTSSTVSGTLSTAANNFKIFNSTRAPIGKMALFKVWNTRISDTKLADLYYEGYHNPLFPKSENIQPEPQETPDPIPIPFSNVYTLDKMTTPAAGDYRKINSLAGDSPLIQLYNVADGTSTTDPEVIQYNVPEGVVTGGGEVPFSRIGSAPATIDSSDNSRGEVGDNTNDVVALQLFSTSSGIGQTINGKVITKAIFWMRRPSSSVTGTLYCRIWNSSSSLSPVATLGSMPASSVAQGSSGDDWDPYTFTNTSNTVAMGSNYRIGIEYQGAGEGDVIDIQRKSGPSDTSAYQTTYDNGGWDSDGNNSFSIKCDLYTGGTGSPSISPWITINSSSQYIIAERFSSTSSLKGKAPTKVEFKAKKKSGTTGTLYLQIVTSSGGLKSTLKTWDIATELPTTDPAVGVLNLVWQDLTNTVTVETNERLTLSCAGTLSSTEEVYIMSNSGNNTPTTDTTKNHNSTSSYIEKRNNIGSWSTYDNQLDITGKITTGGNNFDAWLRFSETRTRIATKAVNNQSSLHNDKITKVVARIKKVGSPSGIISCRIRDPNDVQRVLFSSVDVSTIPANSQYNDVEFTNFTHTYLMNSTTGSGDKVVYEYSGASSSNYIELNSNNDVLDSSNLSTITQTYDSGNYVDHSQRDLAGKMYTGGEPDLNSRTRVVQSIEHQNSRLKGKKITRVKVYLYRTTTNVSGTVTCNIMRGSDDSLVKSLGAGTSASTLSTNPASPSFVTFEDTTNNYPLTVGDKVSVQFTGGNATDAVGVLVRTVDPNYDGSDSYIRKYDEVDYDDEEPTKDLCGTMEEGGFDFYPEPGSIPDPTPVADKDLILCAGNNKKSGFFECFLMEFRIYTKDITTDQADNLYNNRYSISPIGHGQILCPLSFRAITLDPV